MQNKSKKNKNKQRWNVKKYYYFELFFSKFSKKIYHKKNASWEVKSKKKSNQISRKNTPYKNSF